jgi:hypothetical protein
MSRIQSFLGATLLLVGSGMLCFAQVEQGAITGIATDATGASVPVAKASATNQATGAVATSETASR